MSTDGKSPHSHGRSEVWERTGLARALRRERRKLGARLRQLRRERDLSQESAAELVGIHPKHLQRVENGGANVTIATLVAITLAYRVPLAGLFTEPESRQ